MRATKADVIWLVRHGNREDFIDPDWGKTALRPQDPGLSPDGIEQARAAGERLKHEAIDRIFTSPYLRCAQTAHFIAEHVKAPVHVEPGLGELHHPDWSQGLPALLSMSDLEAATGAFDTSHDPLHEATYPETIEHAFARAEQTARGIAERYRGPLLLVGHAVSVLGIARTLSGEQGDLLCPLASLFRLERAGEGWKLALAGDTSHLPASIGADRFH
jgi:broad specificity phosphatase PhoE